MAERFKGVFEDDKGNQYYHANDTETTYDQAGVPLNNGGDLSEASVNFSVGTARKALTPKARFKALMGDIAKWLADLGTAAFCNVANNDTTTVPGFVAGAQIVKTHGDEIDKLYSDLGGNRFGYTSDGRPGWKEPGADTVIPFKSGWISGVLSPDTSYPQTDNDDYFAVYDISSLYNGYRDITIDNIIVQILDYSTTSEGTLGTLKYAYNQATGQVVIRVPKVHFFAPSRYKRPTIKIAVIG